MLKKTESFKCDNLIFIQDDITHFLEESIENIKNKKIEPFDIVFSNAGFTYMYIIIII